MIFESLPSMKHLLAIGVGLIYFIKFSAVGAFICWGVIYITQQEVWSQRTLFWGLVSGFACGLMGFIYGLSLSEWMWS
ncbi:hypothetical protein J7I01_004638 [Vibrio parahaemolyticus]|nr:hypothetical protein [Vibrio parahaemolyticus]